MLILSRGWEGHADSDEAPSCPVPSWSTTGLRFALDPSTVPPSLRLSKSLLTVTYQGDDPATFDPAAALALPQVCADVVIARGQYYWEVDVCNSAIYRIGEKSPEWVGSMAACSLFPEVSQLIGPEKASLVNVGKKKLIFDADAACPTQERLK